MLFLIVLSPALLLLNYANTKTFANVSGKIQADFER